MILYVDSQYASPYAMSAFVALQEKSLPFELATLDLSAGESHDSMYSKVSLTERVPTLVDGDFALSESSAITEYLDEVYPGTALYPSEPQAKARARQVQAWLRSDLMPIRQERTTEVLFYGPTTQSLSEVAQRSAARLFTAASALLSHGHDYLFGSWSIADVDLAVMLNRLVLNRDQVPDQLTAYATRQWERPSVQAWLRKSRPPL